MKSLPVVFTIFVVVVFKLHNDFVQGEGAEKTCKQTIADLTKQQMGLISVCGKSMKFKNGKEKSKKQNCILRCVLIKAEVVNADGQVTVESIDYLLNKLLPPSLIDRANKTFYPCMEIGINEPFKTLDEDPYCSSYDPFIKCFMTKVGSVCE